MKIAIIGSGISSMSVAYFLHKGHDITVYEKGSYIGGHSRTIDVKTPDKDNTVAVDTGFIVFNHHNYPNLTRLFNNLGVNTVKSKMSFGVSIDNGWIEYGSENLLNIFAQKRNFLRVNFLRLIFDIMKFNKRASKFVESNPKTSVEDCLRELGLGAWFRDYYLLVMGGAIWSTPLSRVLSFPAQTVVNFFENHGLLSLSNHDRIEWYTVCGGSREYVSRLTASYKDKIRLDCEIVKVSKIENGVKVQEKSGREEQYDHVVLGCHSDEALGLLNGSTSAEKDILGKIKYQSNRIVLHSDTRLMPKRKKAWASWVYLSEGRKDTGSEVSISYWMNSLQNLGTEHPIIVTLNPARDPEPHLIHDENTFEHPLLDQEAILAQKRMGEIQGVGGIWFCGAWQGYGFHEDGLNSAMVVAKALGVEVTL